MKPKAVSPGRGRPTPARAPKTPAAPAAADPRRKVMLVDDHPMMRAGVAQLIDRQPDLRICCEAGDPAEAIGKLAQCQPDLLVTDITMPGRSGIEFIKDILALQPRMPILAVSMHDETVYAERILRAGARGYIMKEAGAEKLLLAIRHVLGGQVYVSERMSARLLDALSGRQPRGSHSPVQTLSDREFEVFQLIGTGKSTKEIAHQLHISPKTVDVHRGHIKEKLALQDATALIRYAVRWLETEEAMRVRPAADPAPPPRPDRS